MAQHEDPTQPGVSKTQLAQAMRQVEREQGRRRFGRRVLLVGAGAAACAGAGFAAVELAPKIGDGLKNELGNDFAAGVEAGRQALAKELLALETIAVEDAVLVADITQFGAVHIIKPLADLASTVASGGLHVLAGAIKAGRDALGHLNINFGWLDSLSVLFQGWSDTISHDQLGQFIVTDVTLADKYLRSLRDKLNQEAHPGATPTPTGTATAAPTSTSAS
jgi:hypothetical protein